MNWGFAFVPLVLDCISSCRSRLVPAASRHLTFLIHVLGHLLSGRTQFTVTAGLVLFYCKGITPSSAQEQQPCCPAAASSSVELPFAWSLVCTQGIALCVFGLHPTKPLLPLDTVKCPRQSTFVLSPSSFFSSRHRSFASPSCPEFGGHCSHVSIIDGGLVTGPCCLMLLLCPPTDSEPDKIRSLRQVCFTYLVFFLFPGDYYTLTQLLISASYLFMFTSTFYPNHSTFLGQEMWLCPLTTVPVSLSRFWYLAQSKTPAKSLCSVQGISDGSESKDSACSVGDLGSIPGSRRFPGEGHDHPLQYSCLETPRNRGAWWAIVHGVTKSHDWVTQHTQLIQAVTSIH